MAMKEPPVRAWGQRKVVIAATTVIGALMLIAPNWPTVHLDSFNFKLRLTNFVDKQSGRDTRDQRSSIRDTDKVKCGTRGNADIDGAAVDEGQDWKFT